MQVYLHPTRQQALTLRDNLPTAPLTLWSLATNPATKLTQRSVPMAGAYSRNGVLCFGGAITGAADGSFFALAHQSSTQSYSYWSDQLELCHWHDLSVTHTLTASREEEIQGLASSPDGRWLVTGSIWASQLRLVLRDRLSGEVMCAHSVSGDNIVGLTFDATSTFVAGIVTTNDDEGRLVLWQLVPVEPFVPGLDVRSIREEEWFSLPFHPQDYVPGMMALIPLDWDLDVTEIVHNYYRGFNSDFRPLDWGLDLTGIALPFIAGLAVFSSDSRTVIFSLTLSPEDSLLLAYEVSSGRRLWVTHNEGCGLSPFVLTPNGKALICSNAESYEDVRNKRSCDLLVYRMDDGTLAQRLPSGLSESVEALLFDHDGATLWLATQEALVQYQSPPELKTWMEA
jgi:WD40 repeat protein